jgi:hypothetical protein
MAKCRGTEFIGGLLLGGLVGLGLAWLRGGHRGGADERPLEESRAGLRARFAGPAATGSGSSPGA